MGIVAVVRSGPGGYSAFALEDSAISRNVDASQLKDLAELEDVVRSAFFTTTKEDSLGVAEEAVRVAEATIFGLDRAAFGVLRDGLKKKIEDCRLNWRNKNFFVRTRPMIFLGLAGAIFFILRQVLSSPSVGLNLNTLLQEALNYSGDFGQSIAGIALGTVLAFALRSSRLGPDAAGYLSWYGLPPKLYAFLVILVGIGLYIVVVNGWVDVAIGGNGNTLGGLAQEVPFLFGFLVGLFEKPLGDLIETVLGATKPQERG